MIKRLIPVVLLALLGAQAQADEASEVAAIKKMLAQIVPDETPEQITRSPLANIYEVVYGAQIMYVSADGRYLVQGDLYDLSKRANLTENTRNGQRLKMVKEIDSSTLIIFKPKGKTKHVLTVFTDIDCGYCRKLHAVMDEYLQAGIEIRYLAFPRAGVGSKSYEKAVSVWCSSDKQAALTEAKAGKTPAKKECKHPVDDHMALASRFGVTGTPTLVLDTGDVIPGFVEPGKLSAMLEGRQAAM